MLANCIPTSCRGVRKDKWMTQQVFYQLWVFYWGGLRLLPSSGLHPAWVPKGADVTGAPVHKHTHICAHSTEQQAEISLAGALISPMIRAINHNIQNMQEKWQRALKMGDVILPAHPDAEKSITVSPISLFSPSLQSSFIFKRKNFQTMLK